MIFVKLRVVLFEVLQPAVQLPENAVQPLDEFHPVVTHLDSTKVLVDRNLHLVETARDVRLRNVEWVGTRRLVRGVGCAGGPVRVVGRVVTQGTVGSVSWAGGRCPTWGWMGD